MTHPKNKRTIFDMPTYTLLVVYYYFGMIDRLFKLIWSFLMPISTKMKHWHKQNAKYPKWNEIHKYNKKLEDKL
jgi:hypothetical protein